MNSIDKRQWLHVEKPPALADDAVHVWRVPLASADEARALRPLLSDAERVRADRFFRDEHRIRYTIAHGWLRRILSWYLAEEATVLIFEEGAHGKPSLAAPAAHSGVQFNLAHSADLALIAVTRGRPVGVDLERWDAEIEHIELSERFFSPAERQALRAHEGRLEAVVAGFFAAWSRKEAYLKATGDGITRGLHHFDVSLDADRAQLLADRLDENATSRWVMSSIDVAPEYSAALVVEAPLRELLLLHV
jgi:4'-phosphopantetheinyl transferase